VRWSWRAGVSSKESPQENPLLLGKTKCTETGSSGELLVGSLERRREDPNAFLLSLRNTGCVNTGSSLYSVTTPCQFVQWTELRTKSWHRSKPFSVAIIKL
jgi:hypothetical protein